EYDETERERDEGARPAVDHADRQRQVAEPNKVLFEFLAHLPPLLPQSVFQRSGDRFASRKRVKSKSGAPFRFYRNAALVLALRDEARGCPQHVALCPEHRKC